MKIKLNRVIVIISACSLGVLASFYLHDLNLKSKINYEIISYFIIGIILIIGSFDTKLKSYEKTKPSKLLTFIGKARFAFRFLGIISIFIGIISIVNIKEGNKICKLGWTDELVNIEIEKLYKAAPPNLKAYPVQYHEYCECFYNNLKDTIPFDEYVSWNNLPKDSMQKIMIPFINDCMIILQKSISIEKKDSTLLNTNY